MALTISPLEREFKYHGTAPPDPNPAMSVEAVQQLHAATYPELANAKAHIETKAAPGGGSRQIVTFNVAVGTKG